MNKNNYNLELSLSLQQVSEEVAETSGHENKKFLEKQIFSRLSIDSRTLKKGDLYIAIRGERCDGHDYIKQVMEKGAIACVVDHNIDTLDKSQQIIVKDCKLALGMVAKLWLQQWKNQASQVNGVTMNDKKVIAITGSCGKTTVKEMLKAVLEQKQGQKNKPTLVLSTQGNLNNEYGVPLTIMQLKSMHHVAIIEMGANHQQEIAYLSAIAKPDIAIITNAGSAHVEGFGSLDGVAKGKGEIYSSLNNEGIAIINNDDKYAHYWKQLVSKKKAKTMTFAINNNASFKAQETDINEWHIKTPNGEFNLKLAVLGQHNVANALAVIAVGQVLQATNQQIKQGLENFKNISGRLEKSQSQKTFMLINDSYNANPDSVKAAIKILSASKMNKKVLILGDMGELGKNEISLHEQVGKYAAVQDINNFYTVGKLTKYSMDAYTDQLLKENKQLNPVAKNFSTIDELIEKIETFDLKEAMVIVKGSRKMAMENVFYALEKIA
jgi:UDP-N-acetylmuramoyl-tripeptide--D-alanyl-D-alanine ligase